MIDRAIRALAFALALAGTLAGPAWGEVSADKPAPSVETDPIPNGGAAPDPLTPPEKAGPPPAAPGAPTAAEAKPAAEVDAIVTVVRQQLAAPRTHAGDADRADFEGLVAYYAEAGQAVWTGKDGFTRRAQQAIDEIRKADDWGLKASAFELPAAPPASASTEVLAEAEIKLGLAVLKYARHARGGRLDPPSISRLFDQKPTLYDPKTLMQAIAAAEAADVYLRKLHPRHPQFELLRQAMLAARGAKPEQAAPEVNIPAGPVVKPGRAHPHVALVRQRLAAPAAPDGKDETYDEALVAAVKAFQAQNGLAVSGDINTATRNAMNGVEKPTPAANLQRIIVNMERWRWMPEDLGPFYVWDSVPEQMTSVYEGDKRLLHEKIVVGKPSSPTPIFSADMQFIIFHPSWGVPPGIKMYELAPALRSAGGGFLFFGGGASSVLAAHGLRVTRGGQPVNPDSVNWSSVDIRSFDFTQPPGPNNVLGIVKFRFPNKHDVYMHDTPERHLFGGAIRAFSHGCMRVQNPVKLAEVLLAHDKGMTVEQVQEHARRGGEIKLTTPIPVHVTYFTAMVDEAGKLQFRPDIYSLDSRVASKLEGQAVHIVSAAAEKPTEPPAAERPARAKASGGKQAAKKSAQSSDLFSAIFGN